MIYNRCVNRIQDSYLHGWLQLSFFFSYKFSFSNSFRLFFCFSLSIYRIVISILQIHMQYDLLKFILKPLFHLYYYSFDNHKVWEKNAAVCNALYSVCVCVWMWTYVRVCAQRNVWVLKCGESSSSVFLRISQYFCVCFYLKFNSGRFDAFDNTLTWFMCGRSVMIGFRCGEITCNTINVLSIRFKYWIKSDSDKMYNKMDRLMLLFAQPRCIAAGCSPIKKISHDVFKAKKNRNQNNDVLSMLCVSFV